MNKTLSLLLAQINPVLGDVEGNARRMQEIWESADLDTDLVLFPETALCGYPAEDLVLKPAFMAAIETAIQNLVLTSKRLKPAALIPAPWRSSDSEEAHNSALLIEDGKIQAVIGKHHLPNYGVFDDPRIFGPAPLPDPVLFRGFSLGVMICEDIWYPDIARHLKTRGAQILLVVNASPFDIPKAALRKEATSLRVKETGLPLVYLNQIGGQDDLVFDGGSFVLNTQGECILKMKSFAEDLAALSYDPLKGWLGDIPSPPPSYEIAGPDEIYQALVLGLKDYTRKNGFESVLLGLSGGVDSALTAAIACDALGAQNVRAVMMPSRYTSKESLEDAKAVADNLGIRLETIEIQGPLESLTTALQPAMAHGAPGVTYENLQSRVRGNILMALSNATGAILLSTGNKSEMATGYATLYGDMCGGFNVLKDVYKTRVYELCVWRNTQTSLPVIPARVLTKAPTAELRDNQTDQDTLPPYDILDDILEGLIEQDMDAAAVAKARGHDLATALKVEKMLAASEYKRRQSAPGVKITTRAFGRDRRYPLTNRFAKNVEK